MPRRTSLADALPDRLPSAGLTGDTAILSETASRARRVLPVDLAAIRVPPRLRGVDTDTVSALARSIAGIGLQNPVILRKHSEDPGLLILVAGAHRLEAVKELGWPRIEALVVDGPAEEFRLIEIDENLIRKELTPLDRARFLAERKAIYARLYRTAGRGGDRRSAAYARDRAQGPDSGISWAEETAELVGLSPRTLHRAVSIGEGLPRELADALAATPIAAREGDLFRLAQMSDEDKSSILRRLQAPNASPSTLSQLLGPPSGASKATDFERLRKAWGAAAPETRERFLSWLRADGWLKSCPDATHGTSPDAR